MPRDVNGKEIKIGDIVYIKCTVVQTREDEFDCDLNVKLETYNGRRGTGITKIITLNSRIVEKLDGSPNDKTT